MPISLENFKEFAGLPTEARPASPSIGLLVLSKASGHENNAFSIPTGSIFSSNGMGFVTSENFEFSESSTHIEIAVVARAPGARGNLEASQSWTSPINNLEANNPSAFSGGADAIPRQSRGHIDWDKKSDALCQSQLDIAIENIKTKVGGPPALPDEPRVNRAVYLLAQFYLENRQTQETQTTFDMGGPSKQKTTDYRERIYKAVLRECDNLLSSFIDVSKFMPPVPGQTEESSSVEPIREGLKF